MPAAGQVIRAADFPTTVTDTQSGTFAIASTGDFGGAGLVVSGDYEDCAVVFVAPTSGRVTIQFKGELLKLGTGSSTLRVSPQVRQGDVVGSGSIVADANIVEAISVIAGEHDNGANASRSGFRLVAGLVPGDTYNARLLHRGSSGTNGELSRRQIMVAPAT